MTDIAPELYEAIEATFHYAIANDESLQALIKKAAQNRLLYEEAYRAAERIGRHASESLLKFCDKDLLPDGKMYYNIAVKTVRPILEESYREAAELSARAQAAENAQRGIGLGAIVPEADADRVDGIVSRLSSEDDFDKARWVLGDPVETLTLQAVTDTVRTNAELQWEAGLKTVIVRISNGKCCAWCANLVGTYDYEEHRKTGDDIWRRHANCKCRVFLDNHSGKIQDSHTKKIYAPQEIIDSYEAAGNYQTAQKIREELLNKAKREQAEYAEREAAAKKQRAEQTENAGEPMNPVTGERYQKHDITLTNAQFGKKAGKHAQDFGLRADSKEDRETVRNIIMRIVENADERCYGDWRGQNYPVIFHIKGEDVVVEDDEGNFVTILKGGTNNERVKRARRSKI